MRRGNSNIANMHSRGPKDTSIYSKSSGDINTWIDQLKHLWDLLHKCEHVTKMLREKFDNTENPYVDVLVVIEKCEDFRHVKSNSLAFTVVDEFGRWVEEKESYLKDLLTIQVQLEAFNVAVRQRNIALIKRMCSSYKMKESRHIFIEPLKRLVSHQQYKEACQIATFLELHQYFGIEEFVIPLVLQDKLTVVEEFVAGSVDHQRDLVQCMDTLLGKSNILNEVDIIASKYGISSRDVKREKFHYKPLSKLVARLINLYKLPNSMCPNLNRKRGEGAVQFLIFKKYQEQSLGVDSWREMILEATASDPSLQKDLIHSLIGCDIAEAVFWAKHFNIPRENWPLVLQEHDEKCEKLADTFEENWDNDIIEFHKMSLPSSNIIVVDTCDKFQRFIDGITDIDKIGIDCEWKPSFGLSKSDLALIQIATKEAVYIIDMIILGPLGETMWQDTVDKLFGNPEILKLGFGIKADLGMLSHSLPFLARLFQEKSGFLDLSLLWKHLVDNFDFKFPFEHSNVSGQSLSHLVFLCLGKYLDKSDQFSNWERRPLREGQIHYAALDAYCLLEIFEVLETCWQNQDVLFRDLCLELSMKVKKSPRKGVVKKQKNMASIKKNLNVVRPFPDPIPASSFKVICDVSLRGLGEELRKVGVDTLIPESDNLPDYFIRQASNNGRVVLTRHATALKCSQYLPAGFCYAVLSETKQNQLREVLSYFGVVVRRDDIFSRCKLCNGGSFNLVSQSTIKTLRSHHYITDEENHCDDIEYCGFSSGGATCEEFSPSHITSQDPSDEWVENVNVNRGETRFGKRINVQSVPQEVIDKQSEFFICECCGKVYWHGSHMSRFTKTLKDILCD